MGFCAQIARVCRIGGWLVWLVFLASCNDTSVGNELRIEVIDATGRNAARDIASGVLRVTVEASDNVVRQEATITNGRFDLLLGVMDELEPLSISGEIEGQRTRLIAALPDFYLAGTALARLVFGAPGTCQSLELDSGLSQPSSPLRLTEARRGLALAPWGAGIHIAVGGVGVAGDALASVDFFEGVSFSVASLTDRAVSGGPIGRAHALALSPELLLVLGESRSLLMGLDAQALEPVEVEPPNLHPGAGVDSAMVDLGDQGIAVIGGQETQEITWLDRNGQRVAQTQLARIRTSVRAVRLREDILVMGQDAEGLVLGERVSWTENGVVSGFALDHAPMWMVASPSGDSVLLALRDTMSGAPRMQLQLLRGCDSGCAVDEGPGWEHPRLALTPLTTGEGLTWLMGGELNGEASDHVELIRWEGEDARLMSSGALAIARTDAAMSEYANGAVLVAGGRGPEGNVQGLELCFPNSL